MNKLLKDAIADAKAVRETALANAKAALEEAFAPKLQSMLSHKIKEEMDEEGEELPPLEGGDEQMELERMRKNAGLVGEEDLTGDEEGMEDEVPADEEGMEDGEAAEDDLNLTINGQEYRLEPVEDEEGAEDMEDLEGGEEGEVSDEELAELIAELEGEDEEQPADVMEAASEGEEEEVTTEAEDPEATTVDEEVNLEEVIAALKEGDDKEEEEEEKEEKVDEAANQAKMTSMEKDLNEAYSVVKYLRSKLSEVNLLNAKLLFVNKLFRKGELSEAQKIKVIETFDRAKNVREAKLIYTTLAESMSSKPAPTKPAAKKKMTEGLASAAQKSTKPAVITESNGVYDRFKTLVNFNKEQ